MARKGSFAETKPEEDAALIRGILISRLDDVYHRHISPLLRARLQAVIRAAIDRDTMLTMSEVDRFNLDLFQAIQLALFPEEFAGESETIHAGLVPKDGRTRGLAIKKLRRFLDSLRPGCVG